MGIFDKQKQQEQNQDAPLHIFDKADCGAIVNFCEVHGISEKRIVDAVKLGDWKEVEKLSTETVKTTEADALDGLIIKGYETKFGKTNENGEQYEKDCLDEFINEYYIKNKLNIPVTIQHRDDIRHLAGRVLLVEVNTVGFYFVCYIPKTYRYYEDVLNDIKNGILQGMSKEGYVQWNDMDYKYDEDGYFDHVVYKKFRLTAMSIVSTPANGVAFEKVQQVKNAVEFHKTNNAQDKAEIDPLRKMFH